MPARSWITAALLLGTALSAPLAHARDADTDWSNINILLLNWSQSSNPFFEALDNGAMDAAEDQGITLDIQFGEEDPVTQSNKLEAAIASGVNGISVGIADDDAYDEILCRASEAGVAVVTNNIDDTRGAEGTCRLAFMGQDFVEAGYNLGKRMIEEHGIREGDLVFTPVEAPEGSYAVKRHEGVQKALSEVGATSEILGTGNDHGTALNLMTQYLLGHPDVKAIISLGQTPNSQAVQAAKDAGLEGLPIGGFDISQSILRDIADGTMTAAVDQQPYSQGYYSVTQLALYIKYGLYPSEMNTGGAGLVDKTNYQKAQEYAGAIR
ncbi:substrate-binding domain-containing protein [Amaricoccus solimangrovi]|uniref:Substrate-binding domain-containing protein n=1 Tax=Amaricoccus solimangrovi TaxID=2589815 RepID=A0A501WSC5_9RHOB|nr:substrate-binding domain-containing protein [Amaricoccus solimangrovi]TPE51742.1 substrate-binding domain-containing protein [Amaricoccus solimangrovi]